MIVFDCPNCGRKMQTAEDAAGKRVRCPSCQEVVRAPEAKKKPPPPQPREEPEDAEEEPRARGRGYQVSDERTEEDDSRRPCPMCGEMIVADAVKCRFCGEIFDPALKRAEKKKKKRASGGASDDELTVAEILVAILCSGIGCIIGIVWMVQGKSKGTKMFIISIISSVIGAGLRVALTKGRGF